MNVVIGTSFGLLSGGVKSYTTTLKDTLESTGINSSIVKPVNVNRFQKLAVAIKVFGNRDKAKIEFAKLRIRNCASITYEVIKEKSVNLIHSQDVLYANAASYFKLPLILTVHGPMSREARMLGAKENYLSYLMKQEMSAYKNADHIIAVDTGQKDIIINDYNINPEKISVVLNSVDTKIFKPINNAKNNLSKGFFLVPRRLVRKNGVHVAIEAFKNMQDLNLDLWIAGDGPEKINLENKAKELGLSDNIRFLGSVDQSEMVKLMNQSKGIIIPSVPVEGVIEASSISALEGMSVSKPVVASNIGGLAEIIKHNNTGLLFNEGDDKELAEMMRNLVTNDNKGERIGANARDYVINNHSTEVWIKKVAEIYDKTL